MKQQFLKASKNFWRYAFESHRETSKSEYLWAFLVYMVPFMILFLVTGQWTSTSESLENGKRLNILFNNSKPAVIAAYGLWLIPVASLTISRLKTLERRTAWALLLILPVLGPIITLWPCLNEKYARGSKQPLLAPDVPRGAQVAPTVTASQPEAQPVMTEGEADLSSEPELSSED